MGLGISWKKAAIISAVVHLVALFIAVIFFVVVPAIQDMETYEIDLTQSVLDDGGSGHAGGGGGNRSDLFPKPLSADEVAARTKAVVANVDPSPATDIPDAVDVAQKGGEHKGNTSGDNSAGGSGPGHGGGSGGGNGTGIGTGNGDGQGQGNGNGHGTVKAAFDVEGFRARVQDNAQMPSMALKRKLQGDVTVQVTLDTNGSLIGQSIIYSTNEIFNDAAMSAVVAATPYKNPTGEDINIKVPVEFRGHESSDDEEE
ncbi:energy transducer TonB [Veillonella sp.]|uniref:energy transducer TonB family protein n=1 Tax=Veillonella sp. TaxID=1926307 RepID=UPI00290AB597|nr:energy transducer TonB [Veillonella sp.]MDU4105034.1 energy transducer TonB [Veillonella sp.]